MLRFFGPSLARSGLVAPKLTAPFARIVDRVVTNAWLRRFLDLECFVLSGMLAKDTICAEVCLVYLHNTSHCSGDVSAELQPFDSGLVGSGQGAKCIVINFRCDA